jgi:mono/diheme cytochrome c family protein
MARRLFWTVPLLFAAALMRPAIPAAAGQASDASKAIPSGSSLYATYCAVCHGSDARGTGPLADSLRRRPADLTLIARRSKSGFDREMVRRIVDGRDPVKGHGGGDMPVWGDAFERSADAGPAAVNDRLDALVDYLAAIQAK